ncbi:unnamed protein product [Adineta steineri]|uniref:alpha-amylase n=1 Tax=Adineta steineri TaxID=433720 RepID=A0A819DKJ3_9BILA|nr:unnamed protein product [Adineta steineri]CAF3837075.1 unnamed protein product [Adineta steineri]
MLMIKIYLLCLFIIIISGKNASEWRSRSIYQILTDRFSPPNYTYNQCIENPLPENASRNYCGGTYQGAIDQLDYIEEMGFNAIWISPIPSNIDSETMYGVGFHGYWMNHLYQLNKYFGSENDLIEFINEAHKRDIWIMLDVVANHVGPNISTNYFPFNKPEYFHQPLCFIQDYDNQTQDEFCSVGSVQLPLPDLNTENDFVITTLVSWIKETVEKYNFDGIRIDTFRHIRQSFWINYTSEAGVYSVGEVATSNTSYVGSYQYFADGVLHYPLYFVLKLVFTDDNPTRQSMFTLEEQVQQNEIYFKDATLCGTFLDNHDQDRFLNHTQNPIRIQNALVYLMFSDGIPIFYYGTEQNFTGNPYVTNGATDPWNRLPLWTSGYNRTTPVYKYISKLNQIRSYLKNQYDEQFFISHQKTIFVDENTYVYQKDEILVIISNEPFNNTKYINLTSNSCSKQWKCLISGEIITVNRFNLLQINNWLPRILQPFSS